MLQSPTDDIHDWVGPGYKNGFYDAYDAGARKMFWRQMDENLYSKYNHDGIAGVDAWWMDASEPNVRDCTPMWYRKALSGPTALGTSTEYFNAYSTVNADAIYNGQRSVWKGKMNEPRVFLLTRSGFAGEQRFSTATWSGDIGTRLGGYACPDDSWTELFYLWCSFLGYGSGRILCRESLCGSPAAL